MANNYEPGSREWELYQNRNLTQQRSDLLSSNLAQGKQSIQQGQNTAMQGASINNQKLQRYLQQRQQASGLAQGLTGSTMLRANQGYVMNRANIANTASQQTNDLLRMYQTDQLNNMQSAFDRETQLLDKWREWEHARGREAIEDERFYADRDRQHYLQDRDYGLNRDRFTADQEALLRQYGLDRDRHGLSEREFEAAQEALLRQYGLDRDRLEDDRAQRDIDNQFRQGEADRNYQFNRDQFGASEEQRALDNYRFDSAAQTEAQQRAHDQIMQAIDSGIHTVEELRAMLNQAEGSLNADDFNKLSSWIDALAGNAAQQQLERDNQSALDEMNRPQVGSFTADGLNTNTGSRDDNFTMTFNGEEFSLELLRLSNTNIPDSLSKIVSNKNLNENSIFVHNGEVFIMVGGTLRRIQARASSGSRNDLSRLIAQLQQARYVL